MTIQRKTYQETFWNKTTAIINSRLYLASSSWPIQSLMTMSLALPHFFCVDCGWQWIAVTQKVTPSVAISSQCFPGLQGDVETQYVTQDNVFVVQFRSVSSARHIIELAIKDMLRQVTVSHTMDMAYPAQCCWLMMVMRSYEHQQSRVPNMFWN